MPHHNQFGQYCPLALASQLVCSRWTHLIIRELLFGSHSFNDISQGVPRMSRTLLSNRLKEMISNGIITKSSAGESQSHYHLTEAGKALGPLVTGLAKWGQEWLNTDPMLEDIDIDLLMWDIRRNAVPVVELPERFVVEFYLNDAPQKKQTHWLIFEGDEVEVCIIDRGFDVDVYVDATVKTLTQVWMGWKGFDEAVKERKLILKGNKKYIACAEIWMGKSSLAGMHRQPEYLRI